MFLLSDGALSTYKEGCHFRGDCVSFFSCLCWVDCCTCFFGCHSRAAGFYHICLLLSRRGVFFNEFRFIVIVCESVCEGRACFFVRFVCGVMVVWR